MTRRAAGIRCGLLPAARLVEVGEAAWRREMAAVGGNTPSAGETTSSIGPYHSVSPTRT